MESAPIDSLAETIRALTERLTLIDMQLDVLDTTLRNLIARVNHLEATASTLGHSHEN